jgi:hypothetical protein
MTRRPIPGYPKQGANPIPRKATPIGATVEASMTIAVQMMFVDVAAIAVVPWKVAWKERMFKSDT